MIGQDCNETTSACGVGSRNFVKSQHVRSHLHFSSTILLIPQIDCEDPQVRKKILSGAIKRASKWISLSLNEAKRFADQVGGVSVHKKPLLCLKPDYVLKPLHTDHRGIREMAFYEAIEVATRRSRQNYSNFLTTGVADETREAGTVNRCLHVLDTCAVALSFLWKDPVVMASEAAMKEAWNEVKREKDALNRLTKFLASYYGVVGQRKVLSSTPYGVSEDAHLLLQDVTINFSKPCIMDVKMGTQSYEPDAPSDKKNREIEKYPQQEEFGFRVIGMRYYDPSDAEGIDQNGYVFVGKQYGRSLSTRDQLRDAFKRFFTSGMDEAANAKPAEDTAELEDEDEIGEEPEPPSHDETIDDENPTSTEEESKSEDITEVPSRKRLRMKTVSNLLLQVRSLRRWFEENESRLRFYASSLLIVFEGDVSKSADQGIASLRMIDFGRVRRRPVSDNSTTDTGYLQGIQTLHDLLTDLLEEEKELEEQDRVK